MNSYTTFNVIMSNILIYKNIEIDTVSDTGSDTWRHPGAFQAPEGREF